MIRNQMEIKILLEGHDVNLDRTVKDLAGIRKTEPSSILFDKKDKIFLDNWKIERSKQYHTGII